MADYPRSDPTLPGWPSAGRLPTVPGMRTVTAERTDHRSFWMLTASQFLGAFNDNAFRQFLLVLALFLTREQRIDLPWWPQDPQPLLMAAFALPFVLFALLGGVLADRWPKQRVIVWMKALEILVMAVGMAVLWIGSGDVELGVLLGIGVLFLMATQSAFFGPSKYGSLPELVEPVRLTRANGIVNMTTNVAIILGTALPLFRFLTERDLPLYQAGFFFIAVATCGWLFSLGIRRRPAAAPELAFQAAHLVVPLHAWRELRHLWKDRELVLVLMLQGWFYLVGACTMAVINRYGEGELGLIDAGTRLLPFVAGGIALGSLLVGYLSRRRLELGIASIGILGMAVGFIVTGASSTWIADQLGPWLGNDALRWTASAGLAITGLFGGIFVVPLATYLQAHPPAHERGRVLGVAELINFVFIFLAAGVYALLSNALELPPPLLLVAMGILTLAGCLVLLPIAPHFMARLILWPLANLVYRVRVLHPERLPAQGGVLLVTNHVSFADPFVVGVAMPRFVRFLMHRSFSRMPVVGAFSRLLRVIPIADTDGPRALLDSLHAAADHIAEGHVACIFAEGGITRTGNLQPFAKGLGVIARRAGAPIVPVYIDRMWGSIFSYQGGRFFTKWPRNLPYPATVAVGHPLPPDTPIAVVREALLELGAEAFDARKQRGTTLATRFLRVAARTPWRLAAIDHTRRPLRTWRLLAGALLLRGLLRQRLAQDERYVGILLPPSQGGLLANVAVTLTGRVAVNLNFTVGQAAIDAAIAQCRIRTVITARPFLEKLPVKDLPGTVDLQTWLAGAGRLARLRAFALALLAPGRLLARLPGVPRDPDAVATVIFSSGSTGSPKGICLTHHNILSNAASLEQVFGVTPRDRVVGVLPLFHSFGYTATVWFPVLSGFPALYHVSPMDTPAIAALIREHGGTIFLSTPTFYATYLRRWAPEDVKTLRIVVSGAEKLKQSLLEAWQERFGVPILQGYGCTELSPAVAVNLPDVRGPRITQLGHKPGTIGHPLPGVAVRVIDPETGAPRAVGEQGLLLVKGPNVMAGYLDQPELTTEVLKDGWYHTGDIACVDGDGFITITDRQSRFAKIGGEMVPHLLVEEAIQKIVDHHSACHGEDCPQVAVTSLPDPTKGERLIVLHTAPGLTADEIVSGLQGAGLPNLWIPRRDAIHCVDEIPRLGTGKHDLKGIRALARTRGGAE